MKRLQRAAGRAARVPCAVGRGREAATSTDESNERPKALAHAAELERRSAAEAAAIDASDWRAARPSASSSSSQHDGGSSSSTDDPSLPTAR